MKEYFSHDYHARDDLNMKKLLMSKGMAGIGLYWCLVELLYESGGYIKLETIPVIAFELRVSEKDIESLISDFGLFCIENEKFHSNGVLKRLEIRFEKSEKARQSAAVRWNKSEVNANALQSDSEGNAIKEKKSKEKEKKINKNTICSSADEHFECLWGLYPCKRGKSSVNTAQRKKLMKISVEEMGRAIDRYVKELSKEKWRKPQNGSTFFNGGYIDYIDENYTPEENKPALPKKSALEVLLEQERAKENQKYN